MSNVTLQPGPDAEPLTKEQALSYFTEGCTAPEDFRIGSEIEICAVHRDTWKMARYDTISKILHIFSERYEWAPQFDNNNIVALSHETEGVLALEPGGQIEFATAPLKNAVVLQSAMDQFLGRLDTVVQPLGYQLMSSGLHPTEDLGAIELIPKSRYAVMAPRLAERGKLAHYMMRGSCAWQCALDYSSEPDFALKYSTAMHVSSLVSALYANSAYESGQPNGFRSKRLHVWMNTDPDRCGLVEPVFQGHFGFEEYYNYVVNMPMMFMMRNDQWINVQGITFAEFMQRGYESYYATWEDWQLHLTSAFPEARLKNFIEIRCADANRFSWIPSFPALYLGIFADSHLMDAAIDLTKQLTWTERMEMHNDIARDGLWARCRNVPVYELVQELVAMAVEGLMRRYEGEEVVLKPVREYLRQCSRTPNPLPSLNGAAFAEYLR